MMNSSMNSTVLAAAALIAVAGLTTACSTSSGTATAGGPVIRTSEQQTSTPTTARATYRQPVASSNYDRNRSPSTSTPIDPYAIGLTADDSQGFQHMGGSPRAGERLSLSPKTPAQFQPTDAVHGFYGEVFTDNAGLVALDPDRIGGNNLSQISFSVEGADFDPDVSPDGRYITFASTQHSLTSDIFIKPVDSRVITRLTKSEGNDVMPKFSPDGTRVAFSSNRSGNWDLFVMPTTGGKAVQITTESSHELHPTWSPDGKYLAFSRLGEVSGKWELWVTEVGNPGVSKFLTYGLFPQWSPVAGNSATGNGERILFQQSKERGDRAFTVWSLDFNGMTASNLTQVASSPYAACINPAWSRDGKWISFATVPNPTQWAKMDETRPTSAQLWMVAQDGTALVELTDDNAVNLMPSWGPGNEIFYISDRGGVDNIWSMSANNAILAATGVDPDVNNPANQGPAYTGVPDTGGN
ncbi:MAG: DPP IV N-terminal domain-containing protein [Phycisphaerales bacterium]